jgi:hypothetical protein
MGDAAKEKVFCDIWKGRPVMTRFWGMCVVVALCCGCGTGDGLNRASVSGKVTVNGTPVEKGNISFMPAKGTKGPSVGGEIKNGTFQIPAARGPVAGNYTVQLNAPQKTGRKTKLAPGVSVPGLAPGAEIDEVLDLPAQYNTKSTLQKEVKAGKNDFDFELTTK